MLVSATAAARHLRIGRRTFEKRRQQGDPLYQPDHVDPDTGTRSYDLVRIDAQRRRTGELAAERAVRTAS